MSECIFCTEEQSGDNEIARNELFRARWDLFPVTPGHAEVVPLRHVQYFEELTPEEMAVMMNFAREVIDIVKSQDLRELYGQMKQSAPDEAKAFLDRVSHQVESLEGAPPQAYNLGLNDGPVAGQSVPHLHLHIMPRWKGDVENSRGGVRNIFRDDSYKDMP